MSSKKLLVIALLLAWLIGNSQNRRFKHLTSEDGISQSEIYTFLEDNRGFIWFGTVDGLNRYDGYKIEVFNTSIEDPHTLSNNTVRSLAEDQFGRIWIGTDNGLNMYNPKTELIYQIAINAVEKKVSIWSLFIKNGYLMVGTSNGLWMANIGDTGIENEEFGFYRIKKFSNKVSENASIRSIVNCKHGGIWVITHNNLSRIVFQENTQDPLVFEDITFSNFVNQRVAVEDSTGNLWIASRENGLMRYNPVTKEAYRFDEFGTPNGPNSEKCSSLAIDKEGNLWLGTLDKGLNFIKSKELNSDKMYFESIRFEPFNKNSLNSNLIYSLYISNDNLLWVGTLGAGVNIFNPEQKKFTHYRIDDFEGEYSSSNFIRSVYAENETQIWTGTHANGLLLFNRENREFKDLGFGTESVFFITRYKNNKKFICSSSGLYLVEMFNNQLRILSHLPVNAVFYIGESKPDIFWVCSLNGLFRIKIENDKIINESNYTTDTSPAISQNNCRMLFYDNNNTLYVGTEGGGLNVILLNEDHFPESIKTYKRTGDSNSISNNYIRSIVSDSNRNIWIGTYTGLNKCIFDSAFSEISFKRYTIRNGLPNNMIQLIVADGKNNLWIGTNGGLSQFISTEERFINYTVHDGIQSNEFSEHTVFKKTDGEIIVGGINGLSTFYPDQIKVSLLKPKTSITGFYLNNEKVKPSDRIGRSVPLMESITLTDTIKLAPKLKNIGFEFSAMIYPDAEKIQYAYMLEGFDNEWKQTNASNRIANYTNLRHGKYTFNIKSTNSDGIWEDSPKKIYIHILTPFYYTWFAYVVYFLIIALILIYFSHFTIIRYATKKKLLLEQKHNEKIHELDVLRTKFFINISHDLRTPLTLIRGPLDVLLQEKNLSINVKEKLELIKRNVKRLNYLVEQLLDVRKAESGKLVPKLSTSDIVSFTKTEIEHFNYAVTKKGLQIKIISSENEMRVCFDPAMISKVYFNVISNAIKYTDQGEILIHIRMVESIKNTVLSKSDFTNHVEIEIRDTGKGMTSEQLTRIFDRFYQDENNAGKGYGIGLSHTKELIDAHLGYIEAESEIDKGTVIRFYLPVRKNEKEKQTDVSTSTEDIYITSDSTTSTLFEPHKSGLKTILIVEDNADMRSFIKNQLHKEYNIIEASDGLVGLNQAKKYIPDLIVSDVMMPNMDGVQFCEKIKADIDTSHIPLILLTAKVDLETKYKGIKTGADDYIPKPFEMEYLLLRITNLLKSREQLRLKFQKSTVFEPSSVTVTSIDEEFLSSLLKAIEEGIPDSNFFVSSLESKMGMSHANFYRKIKSLTGQSGHELLFNMRMKRAYQILSDNKGIRVAEVAYMVGFQNPNYFGRRFKKMFGKSPTEIHK